MTWFERDAAELAGPSAFRLDVKRRHGPRVCTLFQRTVRLRFVGHDRHRRPGRSPSWDPIVLPD